MYYMCISSAREQQRSIKTGCVSCHHVSSLSELNEFKGYVIMSVT